MAEPAFDPPSPRATLRRGAARACYDPEVIRAILDEAFLAHVGVVVDGAPRVIPFVYARIRDHVYLHGSTANRVLRAIRDGAPLCFTVSILDGLVVARSAFHHSVNYRSVVIHGHGEEVRDPGEKHRALRATVEHAIPGRFDAVRGPSRDEFLRTMIVRLPLAEASAKLRSGPPVDEPEDLALRHWAGVLPVRQVVEAPVPDPDLAAGIPVPEHLADYRRPEPSSQS